MMDAIDYAELDAGIVETVRLLRSHGFETTDSGDGVSKTGMACALPYPHVFCRLTRGTLFNECDRASVLLGEEWDVEASYASKDGAVVLIATRGSSS